MPADDLRCLAARLRVVAVARRRPAPPRKRLLALGDTHTGYTHDSIGHALAVIDHLGRQSGLYDTYIRTDSQWITKQPIPLPARNTKNLNDFDAVFLFISGEGNWTDQQKKDFVSFVKEDGKGVVGAHTGNAAFYEWPEFGEMMGGYFDNHPWGIFEGRVVVEAPDFPAMRHFAPSFTRREEFYVLREKPYSREKVRVLAHLDTAKRRPEASELSPEGRRSSRRARAHLREGAHVLVEFRPRRRDLGRSRHSEDVSRSHQVGDGPHAR